MSQPAAVGHKDGQEAGLPKLARSLTLSRSFGAREFVVAFAALSIIAVLALGPHLRHGGFYFDDWSNGAGALQPPGSPDVGDALSYFSEITLFRPVLVLYVPLTYFIFGMHIHYHLAWAAVLAVLAATMFYGVLRTLGVPWVHALLIAALTIVFPWSDATRLWATGDQVNLSITFMAAGLLVALLGLKRGRRRWHAVAAVLYLLSILTYEVTLPLIACLGGIYCYRVGWRAARWRWLTDLVVAAVAGAWVGTHTKRTTSGLSGDFAHFKMVISGAETILGRAGMPLGTPQTTIALFALALILAVGVGAYLRFPDRFTAEQGWDLRRWLMLAGGGLLVSLLGWMIFIPADPYYTPSVYGATNRVNGLAAFGLVLLVYGEFGIIGTLLGQIRPRAKLIALPVIVLLGIVLLLSYTHVLRRHINVWDAASVAQNNAAIEIREEFQELPHGTTVFTSSVPANQTLGVPIFTASYDLDGMVKMEYDDYSLSAYPIVEDFHVSCRANGVTLEKPDGEVFERQDEREVSAPYGTVLLLNLQTGSRAAPQSRRACRRVSRSYVAGPAYLSTTY